MNIKIEVISATRHSEESFWASSALGISLRRILFDKTIIPKITFNNKRGLSEIYNEGIKSADESNYLVFIHDDVWIDDIFFTHRIIEALDSFDVIGVAGNRRRLPKQPAWAFANENFVWDEMDNLSGAVAHGQYPFGNVSYFGSTPASCELLDGVFLATKKTVLIKSNFGFDKKFNFHFYDLDFCRSARKMGLRLGTWPISITHQSGGAFGTTQWKRNYSLYLDKWKD